MNTKRAFGMFLGLTVLVLLALTTRAALPQSGRAAAVLAEAPRALPQAAEEAAAPPSSTVVAQAEVTEALVGAILTQNFTLQAGWNAIYLGVEPINEAPIETDGTPSLSVIEWVFKGLVDAGALESVWTYTQPISLKDFIIDPSEGLWDEPGWERYVPAQVTGADGKSQGFLTNLYSLHADTAYLVKLKAGTSGTLQVKGKPVVSHHRWAPDAWNLAGFPVSLADGATVSTLKAVSPITDIRGLTSEGNWTQLADTTALQYGQSYLVFYGEPGTAQSTDFTAPLDVREVMGSGLTFQAGYQGKRQTFELENLTSAPVTAHLELVSGSFGIGQVIGMPGDEDIVPLPADINIGAGWAEPVVLQVDAGSLTGPAEGLLEITTPGVRWLVPVAAEPGSYDGLWVGEVIVNNVSEARLGATGESDLTISLGQQNASSVRGSAELHQQSDGATTSVVLTVTLSLPLPDPAAVQAIEGTAPYVGGYVFLDENLNGQRDAGERGLSGVTVTLGDGTQTTADDGSYVFPEVATGSHTIGASLGTGYTSAFNVVLPDGDGTPVPNVLPTGVTVATDGLSDVAPPDYLAQVLPEPDAALPYVDSTGTRVQPAVNFGYAVAHTVRLAGGTCTSPGTAITSGTAINGQLLLSAATTLADLTGEQHHIAVERLGAVVACGDIVVGSPTKFADGGGSEFRFRLLLRVSDTGVAELLPHYAFTETLSGDAFPRLSSPALSIDDAVSGGTFAAGTEMQFSIDIPGQDPLNPFKHKYHPDHDNLNTKFEPFDSDQLSPYLWEAFPLKRSIALTLQSEPDFEGMAMTDAEVQELSSQLDWGGQNWGGDYTEVIEGLHQNDITVKGYFIIRHALPGDALIVQDFDK